MVTLLNKKHTRLRIRKRILPKNQSVLGDLLVANDLPEGHCCCSKCDGYRFEATCYPGGCKVELGCMQCGNRTYLSFPIDVTLPSGRFYCAKHPNKGMIVIHNLQVISIGCECCKTEMNINIDTKSNLVMAH